MAQTFVDIRFPFNQAQALTGAINSVILHRREYQHEMLVVDVWRQKGKNLRLTSNSPVAARLKGVGQQPIAFVGYVHSVREIVLKNRDRDHLHRITCVGPTYRMKDGRQRTWRSVTISDVARTLCREYRLESVIEDHSHRIDTLHQVGESDWQFLCRIARQYGYVVYAVGSTLFFHSRDYEATAKRSRAHLLTYADMHDGRSQIHTFDGKFAESNTANREGHKARRTYGGVEIATGKVFSSVDSGLPTTSDRSTSMYGQFAEFSPGTVATNAAEAQAKLVGARDLTRWSYLAEAETDGRRDVAPTSVVYLNNLDNGYDGYWTVIGVEHRFDHKYHYHMCVTLGTDSLGTPKTSKPMPLKSSALVLRQDRLLTPGGPLAIVQPVGGPPRNFLWVGARGTPSSSPSPRSRTVRRV